MLPPRIPRSPPGRNAHCANVMLMNAVIAENMYSRWCLSRRAPLLLLRWARNEMLALSSASREAEPC